jgi:hypothetical protein
MREMSRSVFTSPSTLLIVRVETSIACSVTGVLPSAGVWSRSSPRLMSTVVSGLRKSWTIMLESALRTSSISFSSVTSRRMLTQPMALASVSSTGAPERSRKRGRGSLM